MCGDDPTNALWQVTPCTCDLLGKDVGRAVDAFILVTGASRELITEGQRGYGHNPMFVGNQEWPFVPVERTSNQGMVGVRKDAHRTNLGGRVVIAGDQDDGQSAVCGNFANKIGESAERTL